MGAPLDHGGVLGEGRYILVNLWLGYPYMMLICSGALASIPSDIYEAAMIDGAQGGKASGGSPCR